MMNRGHFHRFFRDVFQQDVLLTPVHVNLTPIEREIYGHYRALYTYAIILYWLNEDAAATPEAISQKVWELVSQKRFYWLFGQAVPGERENDKQIDRRVVRTREALQKAFLDVLAEKKTTQPSRFRILPGKAISAVQPFMITMPIRRNCSKP